MKNKEPETGTMSCMEWYTQLWAKIVQETWMGTNLFEGRQHISATVTGTHLLTKLFQLTYLVSQ